MEKLIYPEIKNYINGEFVANGKKMFDVICPLDGKIISKAPLSGKNELDLAIKSAKKAFPLWSAIPIKERVQIFYRYKAILEKNIEELSYITHIENGKTLGEARAEVEKSIELTEYACSLPQIVSGEILEVSKGVECRIDYVPVGVVASIAPFNFPHMVPHWTIPNAIALGNTMVFKPSEHVPITSSHIAEMLKEAGLPDGVFNVVNGDKEIVEAICDHPDIKAVSFVGSTKVAKIVYARSTSNFKKCAALGGAKNHLIVLPDANLEMTATNVAASMSGCAGQRCMAASAMIGVGPVDTIIENICTEARKIIPGKNLGSVITKQAKERIERYITEAEKQGAKILVDGRNAVVVNKEDGFYVGATVIDNVTPDMAIAKEEVFGPVLAIIRVNSLEDAIKIENSSEYGNAASVFTQNGSYARYVIDHASAGMVGVNIGVPVPREPFSFGGWNESKFGTNDITGKSSIGLWTQPKKTSIKWNAEAKTNWMS
jgi:malonate-semialdehyde dehydrogenase (acetylating)/methylmalonate-semialdehyde dehydrogenase